MIHSKTTNQILASIYLNGVDIPNIFEEDASSKFKAAAPEYYFDVERIKEECRKVKTERNAHRWKIFFTVILGWIIGLISGFLVFSLIIAILLIFIMKYQYSAKNFSLIREKFLDNSKVEENDKPHNDNVVIYGGYSPFVGAGYDIEGWSFVIDSKKSATNSEKPRDLKITEIYESIQKKIYNLKISNLSISDEIYIHGSKLRKYKEFLPDIFNSPVKSVDPTLVEKHLGSNNEEIRHYKHIIIPTWSTEVVFHIFYRATNINDQVFFETHTFILPPLGDKYKKIENFTKTETKRQRIGLFLSEFFVSLSAIITYPLFPLYAFAIFLSEKSGKEVKNEKEEIENNTEYNYGEISSFREKLSQVNYENYFQELDSDMYMKIIDNSIFHGIVEILKEKGISTEDILKQGNTIFNEGVIINGGSIDANSFAVGKGSSAVSKQ